MTKIKIGDQTNTYNVQTSGDHVVLAQGESIVTAAGNGIFLNNQLDHVTVEVQGTIDARASDASEAGIFSYGEFTAIEVGEKAKVIGDRGMDLRGATESVTNHGTITGDLVGIMTYSTSLTIENYGRIGDAQSDAGITIYNGNITNAEGARIVGVDGIRFYHDSGEGRIENHGLIQSQGKAVTGFAGEEVVINRGRIIGDIETDAGNDTIDLRKGTLEGFARGGVGGDLYIVDATKGNLVEQFDQGFDTIKSSASWKMGANFEQLILSGKLDLKATGNEGDNFIYGNKGDNRISGGDGGDYLIGGRGNDVLTGGEGHDVFVFISKGGDDTITRFENGIDKLDMSDWTGVDSFEELLANHVKVKGDDLMISDGDASVLIRDMAKADLDATDFFPF